MNNEFLSLKLNDLYQHDENGHLILKAFLISYCELFSVSLGSLSVECPKCINNYLQQYKTFIMKNQNKEKSEFKLKPIYEGIQLSFGSAIHVKNETITDEQGLKLLNEHPKGKDLFVKLPKDLQQDEEGVYYIQKVDDIDVVLEDKKDIEDKKNTKNEKKQKKANKKQK